VQFLEYQTKEKKEQLFNPKHEARGDFKQTYFVGGFMQPEKPMKLKRQWGENEE